MASTRTHERNKLVTVELYEAAADLMLRALEQPASKRSAWLGEVCEGDDALRREVESLLMHHRDDARDLGSAEPEQHQAIAQLPEVGDLVAGRYRVTSVLGRGGMGCVYAVDDLELEQPIALKLLTHPGEGFRERLRAEVRLARRVNHPSVCAVYDIGEHLGVPFLTMEAVQGDDLTQLLQQVGRLSPARVQEIARELLEALEAAHASGVLHLDLKPGNVLMTDAGRIKIIDFGIARALEGNLDSAALVGTPAYMAPERFNSNHQPGPRADLYSAAMVLYELLTGELPAEALTPSFDRARDVDARLEAMIRAGLAASESDRPESALAMLQLLESPSAAPVAPAPADAERRRLSILCFRASVSPESAAADVPTEFIERCIGIVNHHGGTIALRTADVVHAFFGYPQALDNAAERAVQAGVDLLALSESTNTEDTTKVQLNIGVDSGPVVVEGAGSGAEAWGEAAEIAPSLTQRGEKGSLLASSRTLSLAPDVFDYRALSKRILEELGVPIDVYAINGTLDKLESGIAEPEPGAFVGRRDEMKFLSDCWERVKNSEGILILVVGEAGIGKSRLIQEFRRRIADEPHRWVKSRCTPQTSNTSLHSFRELANSFAKIVVGDSDAARDEKLCRFIEEIGLDVEENAPAIRELIDLPQPLGRHPRPRSAVARRNELIAVMAKIATEIGREMPFVAFHEDAHWVDPSSREFMSQWRKISQEMKSLSIVVARPEFEPPWPAEEYIRLSLGPLDNDECKDLVSRTNSSLAPEIVANIASRVGGIPLFARELARTVAGGTGTQEIPTTLQDSLMLRLDQLGPDKSVICHAAIIGREFSLDHLSALLDEKPERLRPSLQKAILADLLQTIAVRPNERFRFKHALVHETAYESILRKRRRELHDRFATSLRSQFPSHIERRPELLAFHLERAHRFDLSVEYFERAARIAIESNAMEEADHHLQSALESLSRLKSSPERSSAELRVRTTLSRVLTTRLGYGARRVAENYTRCEALCAVLEEVPETSLVLQGIANFQSVRGNHRAALETLKRIEHLATAANAPEIITRVHAARITFEAARGDFDSARRSANEMRASLEPAPSNPSQRRDREVAVAFGEAHEGIACWMTGEAQQALELARRSRSAARAAGGLFPFAVVASTASSVRLLRGDFDATFRWADEIYDLSSNLGFDHPQFICLCLRGIARANLGEAEKGLLETLEGIEALRRIGVMARHDFLLAEAAKLCLEAGRLDQAQELLERGFAQCQPPIETPYLPELHRVRSELLWMKGVEPNVAKEPVLRAIEIACHTGARAYGLRAALTLAVIDPNETRTLREHCRTFDSHETTPDLDRARLHLSRMNP